VIEPFEAHVPESDLDDLRRRLRDTRWPAAAPRPGWDTGVPLEWLQDVCAHWASAYDWRSSGEARLNDFAQFRTTIDGVAIHFLHVRSARDDALPIVMTHGWPGSVFEFLDVVGPLSKSFHLVVPSLPGYGFSDQPAEPGWGAARTARAWTQLMAELGYDRYGAQGGDWGSMVTTVIGTIDADHCAGIHLNMAIAGPSGSGDEPLTESEQRALADMKRYNDVDSGYMKLQSTRPQTLAYALTDSPVGQAAWILEKFWSWVDHDGDPRSVIPVDRLLDNVSLYWLTRTAGSSARMYHETMGAGDLGPGGDVAVPTGVTVFPGEIFRPSRRWAERRYPHLVHFTEQPRGGHFAAFEQPDLFVDDVRAFFSSLS
jgi:pimeloyl-ACP methyl ester carboxylesterase